VKYTVNVHHVIQLRSLKTVKTAEMEPEIILKWLTAWKKSVISHHHGMYTN